MSFKCRFDARRLRQTGSWVVSGPNLSRFVTRRLKQYLEPFKDPDHLPHIKNLRIGTRALTFWPQRFTTDPDADSLIELLRDVKEVGGRHIAIMSHLSHYRELSTKKVQDAIHRLKQEGGVIIRSQSPVMAGINDDAAVRTAASRDLSSEIVLASISR
jgi:L-lysine 2,3-aminomutase